MATWSASRKWCVVACACAAIAAGAIGWVILRDRPTPARDPSFVESAEEAGLSWQMRFLPREQGETFKINLYDHGSGVAVGDYDGDGHDDLYFCNQLGPNALYRNQGDGTFEDVTEKAGVALGDRICVAATFADYDNDGDADLFVTSTRGGNVLFRNEKGTFTDVTKGAGLTHVGHSQVGVFFDYDLDGWLDLFLTNTAAWTTETFDGKTKYYVGKEQFDALRLSPKESNVLYRNTGRGTFVDATAEAGLKGRGWAGDAVPFDYDGDGDTDLFVTCMFGRCQLYQNDGKGRFTDVTRQVLGATPWGAVGARLLDFDNDGRLDLFIADMHSDMWMGLDWDHTSLALAQKYEKKKSGHLNGPDVHIDPELNEKEKGPGRPMGFRPEDVLFGNGLYHNEGGGKFTEVSDRAGAETFWPWGAATGDFDNDDYEDLFLPAGMGYPFYYWPNSLLMNQADGTFQDRAADLGIEPPARGKEMPQFIGGRKAVRSSRCAVAGDFDGDGRLEVVVNNFNDRPYYFRNHFPQKHHVSFRLRGTKNNRDAVGAVVRLYQGDRVLTRQVQNAGGYLSQSSHTLHFGLGERPHIDRVEVTWPGGRRQELKGIKADTRHEVVEPAEAP